MQFGIILDHPTPRSNDHHLLGASLSNKLAKSQVPRGRERIYSTARFTGLASGADTSAALGAGAVKVDEYGSALHSCLGLSVDV